MKIIKSKEHNEKRLKQVNRDLSDTINWTNTCIMKTPEGEKKERGRENIWKTMAANFPTLIKTLIETKAQQIPSKMNSMRLTQDLSNFKSERQRIWKQQEKWINRWKGSSKRSQAGISSETLEARRPWTNTFQGLEEQNLSTKNAISSKNVLQKWAKN